jgi:TRAP-type C4-dicarboxylate transport system permease large subunit
VGDVISGSQTEHEMMGLLFLIWKLLFCYLKELVTKSLKELLKRVAGMFWTLLLLVSCLGDVILGSQMEHEMMGLLVFWKLLFCLKEYLMQEPLKELLKLVV